MDKTSKELFDKLVRMQPHEWSATDIEFMKARQSYLSDQQKTLFAKVLGAEAPAKEDQAEEEEAPRAAGRKK
jgi:hypothetical protein